MISQITKHLASSLQKQLTSRKLDAMFARLPAAEPAPVLEDIGVCALQMEIKTYPSVEVWLRSLDAVLAQAVSRGSRLVCLPEFYAMVPLLCHTLVNTAIKGLSLLPAGSGGAGAVPDLRPYLAPFSFLMPAYEDIICRFARRYGIYLYGGTGFVPEGGQVYNRGFLATPEGSIAARQDKIHLTQEEFQMGITPGDTLAVVPTPIGNIALSVCMDATYFETFRVAKALGADYIIVPIGDLAEFDPYLALRGAQMRVNETGLAAIKPALVSSPGFPLTFSGKAGIYFPMATGLNSVEYPQPREAGMVTGSFRLPQLQTVKSELFQRTNPAFQRNYCGELIQAARLKKRV